MELVRRHEAEAAKRAGIRQKDMNCWGEPGSNCPERCVAKSLCTRHNNLWIRNGTTYPQENQIRSWAPVIARAAAIVHEYREVHGIQVTLRQLFYRLVSEELITNTPSYYNTLSSRTAEARRLGNFPTLLEHGRKIEQYTFWEDPAALIDWARAAYRVDRTKSQPYTIVLAVEKNALKGLLVDWFGNLGIPILPLGGYGSETLERKIRAKVAGYERPAVFIYAGDFDASGVHIWDEFTENTEECWIEATRIGLTDDQIDELGLPVLAGKKGDPRAAGFIESYPEFHASHNFGVGVPVQVELDAVEPTMLRDWYKRAIDRWWDEDAYQRDIAREGAGDEILERFVNEYEFEEDDWDEESDE